MCVEILVDVSPTVRSCSCCGQSMVIKQKKDGAGLVARIFCHGITRNLIIKNRLHVDIEALFTIIHPTA